MSNTAMTKMTILTAGLLSASALFLTGCAEKEILPEQIDTEDPRMNGNTLVFNDEQIEPTVSDMVEMPAISDVTENSFVLTQGGSSSCPNVVETVNYDEESNTVALTYMAYAPDRMCTSDFRVGANLITLQEDVIPLDATFTVQGMQADVLPSV